MRTRFRILALIAAAPLRHNPDVWGDRRHRYGHMQHPTDRAQDDCVPALSAGRRDASAEGHDGNEEQ
jgi:hypothetical protein